MKGKSDQRKMIQGWFLYSRVRFQRDDNGREKGWYFMLTPRKA